MKNRVQIIIPAKMIFIELIADFFKSIVSEMSLSNKRIIAISIAIKDLLSRIILSEKKKNYNLDRDNFEQFDNSFTADKIDIDFIIESDKINIEIKDTRKPLQSKLFVIKGQNKLFANAFDTFQYFTNVESNKPNIHKICIK
jgi:anti-sigma regulatory factor (Ser/Thr protein kinase)